MATTTQAAGLPASSTRAGMTPTIMLIAVWQIILGIGLVFGITHVWNLPALAGTNQTIDQILRLGDVVRWLIMVLMGIGAFGAFASAYWIFQLNNSGRLLAMLLNFFLFALGLLYLGNVLGLYLGLDNLAEGLWRNAPWLLGFPIGYVLVWLGGKQNPSSDLAEWLPRVGLGIMMLALIVILWNNGLLTSLGDLAEAFFQPLSLVTFVIIAIMLAVGLTLVRNGYTFNETIAERESWQGWLFLMPNFVNFLLFFAMPLLLSFYLSFTDYNVISPAEWVGFENYGELLSLNLQTVAADVRATLPQGYGQVAEISLGANKLVVSAFDPMFWISLGNTFRYCFMLLLLGVVPALLLALLLNSKIPGMQFYRAVFFLPSIAAVVGVALIWQWLYDPVIGFVNAALRFFNPGLEVNWLSDPNVMLFAVVIMAAWQVVGFNAVIFLAGLQAVPRELMEAGKVDGAGPVTRFLRITLPLLAPTTFFVLVTTLISGLQAFSEMYVLLWATSDNARLTTVYYLYEEGFERFNFGNASATAWLLFGVIFIVTLIQFRLSNRSSAYSD
ncbi:MAG: sugar ABC transporter permease [Chloroflexota bacterium]|nr:sugar ABC transporter permease [Chloroflexota bacterium]